MRQLWKLLFGLFLSVILLMIVGWFFLTEGDRKINRNPIMKQIRLGENVGVRGGFYKSVDLKQSIFADIETKQDFEMYLDNYGFKETQKSNLVFDLKESEHAWLKRQDSFACNIGWVVVAQFDESDKILSAEGVEVIRGCL